MALDTFTSMRFQIKSDKPGGTLIEQVISILNPAYQLHLYHEPEPEGHENLLSVLPLCV